MTTSFSHGHKVLHFQVVIGEKLILVLHGHLAIIDVIRVWPLILLLKVVMINCITIIGVHLNGPRGLLREQLRVIVTHPANT